MLLEPRQHTDNKAVIEVDERNFQTAVLDRSRQVPIVIDFWAPWCGPCRTLGPILERLAQEYKGKFVLAKINVDQNRSLATAFRVQGIPAVKAIRDGKIVAEFTGAQPETRVRAWLQQLLPEDQSTAEIESLAASNPHEAIARYRAALAQDPQNAESMLGLGQLLVQSGDQSGIDLLKQVPSGTPQHPRAQAWLELVGLIDETGNQPSTTLLKQLEDSPNDLALRYRSAARLIQEQHYTDAMSQLLAIVERDRSFQEDGARKTLLTLFEALGNQNQAVVQYRRKLANILF